MATDSFGTDGTPPPNWTADSVISDPIAASGGFVSGTNFGTPGLIRYAGSSAARSQFLYSGGFFPNDSGPAIHCDGAGDCYYVAGSENLVRKDNGSATTIDTTGGGQVVTDTINLYRDGSDVVAQVNGVEILRATDTTYMSGSPGLHMIGPFAEYDDWTDGASSGGTVYPIVKDESITVTDPLVKFLRVVRLASDQATLVDDVVRYVRRSRLVSEALTPSDGLIRKLVKGRVQNEAFTLTDETIRFFRRTRLASDVIALLADSLVYWKYARRLSTDNVGVFDEVIAAIVGNNLRTKVMSEAIFPSDEALLFYRRVRLAQDVATIIDALLSSISGGGALRTRIVSEVLDLSDGTVTLKRITKVISEVLEVVDQLVRAIERRRLAGETITMSDNVLAWKLRGRTVDDGMTVADAIISTRRRVRDVIDTAVCDDGTVKISISKRILAELLGVTDEAIANVIRFVTYQFSPRVRIGVEEVAKLGAQSVTLLGAQSFIELGGYN